jgi:hypothetical protein
MTVDASILDHIPQSNVILGKALNREELAWLSNSKYQCHIR